jgi:Na+-translocating ferredoxin:NAD+ oxidoreductase RNF subunit RnfB
MEIILNTLISLSLLGVVLAVILYFVAQKFKVIEDPRIDEVEACLPGANCGGCGYPGCRGFAEACVKAETLDGMFCPAGGNEAMKNVATTLGQTATEKEPQIAVIRCNGTPEKRKKTTKYDGPVSCAISNSLYGGDTDCQYGCLGLGDCVAACTFDAIYMDEESGLPIVDEDKCTACGACVKACPKSIIELRNKGKKSRRIYVSCINKDKGADAKRACDAACIGCGKCAKVCAYDAITIENFLAYIDFEKCKLCRKCVAECPTGAILELNFPPRKEAVVEKASETTEIEK